MPAPDNGFNDFLRAAAALLGAIAWPGVALVLMLRYRSEIGALIVRLREAFGTKFDPPIQQTTGAAADSLKLQAGSPTPAHGAHVVETGQDDLPAEVQRLRSKSVIAAENTLAQLPQVVSMPDPQKKLRVMTIIGAAWNIIAIFERIDGTIWGSQIRLLNHLASLPASTNVTKAALKAQYYDAAASAYPQWFTTMSFDSYLGFLAGSGLLTVSGDEIALTQLGRDYLDWRIQTGKPPKPFG